MVTFEVGMKFNSFEEFKTQLDEYSDENKVCFWKRDLKLLGTAPVKRAASANQRLVYYSLKVCCVMGGRKFTKKKNCTSDRNTKTMRKDCPAHFFLILSKDGQYLQISSMCEVHNHPIDENIYELLPQKRRHSSLIGKAERLQRVQKRLYVSCLKSTVTEVSTKSPHRHDLTRRQFPDLSSLGSKLSDQKKKRCSASNKHSIQQIGHRFSKGVLVTGKIKQTERLTQLQKFRQASTLTDELAQIISESSGEDFDKKMAVVQNLIDFWRYNKEVELTEVITTGVSSNDNNVQIYEEVSNTTEVSTVETSIGALLTAASKCRVIHCPNSQMKKAQS